MTELTSLWSAICAAMTMIGTGFATAWAEKVVGAATVGAMAEKPELWSKGLVLMVIPETIVVFGLVVAIILTTKML